MHIPERRDLLELLTTDFDRVHVVGKVLKNEKSVWTVYNKLTLQKLQSKSGLQLIKIVQQQHYLNLRLTKSISVFIYKRYTNYATE